MGLDIYTLTNAERASNDWQAVPSVKHPNSINNRRYLRSSYNGSGFNTAVPQITGNERDTYYHVFEPLIGDGEEYEIEVTDLVKIKECRKRAEEIVDRLKNAGSLVRAVEVSATSLRPDLEKCSVDDALRLYRLEAQRYEDSEKHFGGAYSNTLGKFWLDEPLRVVGVIPGHDIIGRPCVHLIYEVDDESRQHYLASAEVLVEYCEELADLVKQDGVAYIHWSG